METVELRRIAAQVKCVTRTNVVLARMILIVPTVRSATRVNARRVVGRVKTVDPDKFVTQDPKHAHVFVHTKLFPVNVS